MPAKKKKEENTLLKEILNELSEAKAQDIVVMDLKGIDGPVCDYFVVCSGSSNTHVGAIASRVEKEVSRRAAEKPWHVEGTGNQQWVLMDYCDVVVHVFQPQWREFYDLEGMWGDAEITRIPA